MVFAMVARLNGFRNIVTYKLLRNRLTLNVDFAMKWATFDEASTGIV